jgi:hypothetical protein
MARRSIDMLPLLDVFMVVLFVFASIQEGQLDSSTQELEAAKQRLLDAQLTAATESARAAALSMELEVVAQERRELNQRVIDLATQVADYERACGPRSADGPLCPAATPESRELVEIATVHEQVLANVAVFEIEIAGEIQGDALVNHCCFRPNPPEGEWQRCGVVPSNATARSDWFDEGGDGLRDALRQTRDGYAIVLVQQDGAAAYQIGQDLSNLLHERLRDHYVYDNGVSSLALDCPLLSRP